MKKQEFSGKINSLTELLHNKFPSVLTKRIELDDKFFTEAKSFANETLDFSYYSELEQIINTNKVEGVIKKINISKNKNLLELTFLNQKLIRLDLSSNKKLVTLKVNNNQLTILNLEHNSQLEYLDVSNNEITGTWEFKKCSKIKFFACQNNYLNELRVHKDLRYLLLNSAQNLQSQKHDKEKINPIKNVTYVTLSGDQNNYTKNDVQNEKSQPQTPQPS
jgi:hypothetical protein